MTSQNVLSLRCKTSPWKTSVSLETLSDHGWCLEVRGGGMEKQFIQLDCDVILLHEGRTQFEFLRCCSSKIVHQHVRL